MEVILLKKEINLELVKEKRKERGYSYEDMAKSLGLKTPEKYYRREKGEYKFQASELPALSKKLGIKPLEKIFI